MRHSLVIFAALVCSCAAFYNPIIKKGSDPYVIFWNDRYYYSTFHAGDGLALWSTKDLGDWSSARRKVIYKSANMTEIWAPEIHHIDGQFYIYFAADSDKQNARHRMFVLQAKDNKDPMGKWELKGKLTTEDDNWAIDGTVFRYPPNQKLYYIWSGWSSPAKPKIQNLYIAELKDPLTVSSKRVLLREPDQPWMKFQDFAINEGPEILFRGNRTFLIYSASASWMGTYCLGMMGIDGGKDPMVPSNWWKKDDAPIMKASPQNSVYGPGHASYVMDRKGNPWIVYHAMDNPNGGWAGRTIRTQPFSWNTDGTPKLGAPIALSTRIPNPA